MLCVQDVRLVEGSFVLQSKDHMPYHKKKSIKPSRDSINRGRMEALQLQLAKGLFHMEISCLKLGKWRGRSSGTFHTWWAVGEDRKFQQNINLECCREKFQHSVLQLEQTQPGKGGGVLISQINVTDALQSLLFRSDRLHCLDLIHTCSKSAEIHEWFQPI